jgi:hypothetical protein
MCEESLKRGAHRRSAPESGRRDQSSFEDFSREREDKNPNVATIVLVTMPAGTQIRDSSPKTRLREAPTAKHTKKAPIAR